MRRVGLVVGMLAVVAASSSAQGLRQKIESGLFSFGDCGQPLCLAPLVLAGNVHGSHFIPSAESGNAAIISFLGNAVGTNVSNIPISATTSGVTYRFEGGAPVRTNVSSGPIFAERAQTLGRGRFLIGANASSIRFNSMRGVPLSGLEFNFTHQDTPPVGVLGDPPRENEFINVRTALDVNVLATVAFATYGLTNRIDLSVAVPFVSTSIDGRSFGEIVPFGDQPAHYFAGTATNPILTANTSVNGSASGIGDVAVRAKVDLSPRSEAARVGFALLGDVRLGTGDEDNFLGAGSTTTRVLGILSGRYGNFSPHVNGGAAIRGGDVQTNAVLATLGFDQLMSSWATLAVDAITEWQMGDSKLQLPTPVTFTAPFRRTIYPSNIPDRRDDIINASIGTKLSSQKGFTVLLNALVPLNRGGLRTSTLWTAGLEYGI